MEWDKGSWENKEQGKSGEEWQVCREDKRLYMRRWREEESRERKILEKESGSGFWWDQKEEKS